MLTVVFALSCAACGGGGGGGAAAAPGGTTTGGGAGSAGGGASSAQIAFAASLSGPANPVREIFTMNLDGSNLTQITHEGLTEFLPHFSPDGTKLLFTTFLVGTSDSDPNLQSDVVLYDFATGTQRRLTNTRTGFQPTWSPDGTTIAYGTVAGDALWMMNADGTNQHVVARPSGGVDDLRWGDYAWSHDNWIYFVVAQNIDNCYKTHVDKMRPDGTSRTQVSDGGPNCTPPGMQENGDADPAPSADGTTIYSSRGFPRAPAGMPGITERRLYAFSSAAWTPGKPESDLSLPSAPDCVEGVPKGSPDGTRIMLFRSCAGEPHQGVTLTDTAGSYRTWIVDGFGADWNPVAAR